MTNGTEPTFDELFDFVKLEAVAAFNDLREGIVDAAQTVIMHQMRQIATAVWDVIEGLAAGDYTKEGAAELLDMARRAVAVSIAGATELLFTEVQAAITRIYRALTDFLTGSVKAVLETLG